jgi:uncharacterized protein YdhG (YjbR/CyaY superfamily)
MDIKKKKFNNADEYIHALPESIRGKLSKLREVIKKAAPEAEEVISYGMPAYKYHGVVAYFAASKNHYALYAYPDSIIAFKKKLSPFQTSKGTIRFSYDKPLPEKLIAEIVKYKVKGNLKKKLQKDGLKKNKSKKS